MASFPHPLLINSQVSLHWPPHRRRRGAIFRAWRLFGLWRLRIRQRVELAQFDDRALRDIGLSDADARRELAKWFWHD